MKSLNVFLLIHHNEKDFNLNFIFITLKLTNVKSKKGQN